MRKLPKEVKWSIPTAAALIAMLSYAHGFVFPRTEGKALEARVTRVDKRHEKHVDAVTLKLDKLGQKIDSLAREVRQSRR